MKIKEGYQTAEFVRKVTPLEEMFYLSPYSVVTLAARVRGPVTEENLRGAVNRVRDRHDKLRLIILQDADGQPWFVKDSGSELEVLSYQRENQQTWVEVQDQQARIPFKFEQRPAIRFVLVSSPEVSEIVIVCHHLICDGLSLAYLARDLLLALGNPEERIEPLPASEPVSAENLPPEAKMNLVVKFFVDRINRRWQAERISFSQDDYEELLRVYIRNFTPRIQVIELNQSQTAKLVDRCREEGVTVNSALAAALSGASRKVQGDSSYNKKIAVAGSLRNQLLPPVGEGMGLYASGVSLNFNYREKIGFWENARMFNRRVQPLYRPDKLFREALIWLHFSSGIMVSLSFKMLGKFVPEDSPRWKKLAGFSSREDVIASMLKREGMESFENLLLGTAVTNLGRMDFPERYGELELEKMMMNPGGAYPLVMVNLVAGVVTAADRLTLVLEYAEERISSREVEQIGQEALSLLAVS